MTDLLDATPIILAIVVAADLGLFALLIVKIIQGMKAAEEDRINQAEMEFLYRRMHEHRH